MRITETNEKKPPTKRLFFFENFGIIFSNIFKNSPMNISQKILITAVKNYQKYLSPDHSIWVKALEKPPYCKHIPTCSEYMIEAIEKKGSIIGVTK